MFTGTSFSRLFIRFVALPLLFIAGIQLYVLSESTDVYFAWTIAVPLTAAFLGAGFWSAMVAAYMSWWQSAVVSLRITGPTSVAATGILGIATILHLDKFHLNSPAFLTRFVTWVWIIVYVVTPFLFLWLWFAYGRSVDDTMGAKPFPRWVRVGYIVQAVFTLLAGILLFFTPALAIPIWPWELTPLTSRAISAWMVAYGLGCLAVNRENNTSNTLGTRISLGVFCILQLLAVARYLSSVDWMNPLAWVYVLVMLVGVAVGATSLLGQSKDSQDERAALTP
jgi:hypothetical protein